jgi:hypothetical protein
MEPPAIPAPPAPPELKAYAGDPEDDIPTRLYAPSSPSAPPPPIMTTRPRNDRPSPPWQAAPLPTAAPVTATSFFKKIPQKTLYLMGGAVGVVIAALVLFLGGRSGTLLVSVTGPGGHTVDSVDVFIDGTRRCESSPCLVQGLATGAHLVHASAKGYQETAEQAVAVQAGEQAAQTITLSASGAGTGVRVSALGSGLRLFVDGQEYGELPQTAKGIAPGEHTLKVAGSDRYEPWEEKISLEEGEMKTVGPLRLRVLKGLATFKAGPGADGARVLLDGRLVPELPSTIEVPAGKQLTLLATKPGYSAYRRTISFNDGVAEKTFEITMVEGTDDSSGSVTQSAPQPRSSGSSRSKTSAKVVDSPPPQPPPDAKGKATLNLNSVPASSVILNGRPLGSTPKIGVQVTPGPQTVVFVHPTLGRKVVSGTVAAGETKAFTAHLQ